MLSYRRDLGGHRTIEQQLRLGQMFSTLIQHWFKPDGIRAIYEEMIIHRYHL